MIVTPALMREVAKRLEKEASKYKCDDEPIAINFDKFVLAIMKEYE